MNEPHPESTMICDICDGILWDTELPDERTVGLWLRYICRNCGDRLNVPARVMEPEVPGSSERR